jgi:hypothetical protein
MDEREDQQRGDDQGRNRAEQPLEDVDAHAVSDLGSREGGPAAIAREAMEAGPQT